MTPQTPSPVRVLIDTSMGAITLELDADKAPQTVANFLAYVEAGHYSGLTFHRVIKGFMIQGGGYDQNDQPRKTRPPVASEAKNGLSNRRGTIAMARTSDPQSATCQFFINHADNVRLDPPSFDGWGYAVFGKVVEGMDVVDAIAATRTGNLPPFGRDVPVEKVMIQKATVVPAA